MTAKIIQLADHRDLEIPSAAMAYWLSAAEPRDGWLPHVNLTGQRYSARVIRACVWRGWATESSEGLDAERYITLAGRRALARFRRAAERAVMP